MTTTIHSHSAWTNKGGHVTGHIQLPAQPGDGMPIGKLNNQAKSFGDSCSLHLRGVAEWAGGRSALPPA